MRGDDASEPGSTRDWEQAERARLHAARCPVCQALPPNHCTGCTEIKLPDPGAGQCSRCEFPAGSLGCRMTHGGTA